jgi:hypothetical protein
MRHRLSLFMIRDLLTESPGNPLHKGQPVVRQVAIT